MIDDVAKAHLHDHLRWVREALVWKLEALSEYDVRRPLTVTGTNLLGLVKHCATWDSRYFGEVFGRPFLGLPSWDDPAARGTDLWATEHESRDDILGLYAQVWRHADATIDLLPLEARGFVPWWNEAVPLFNVMVHCLSDTTRHAGHADVLREGLDGVTGIDRNSVPLGGDAAVWAARRDVIERAARAVEVSRSRSDGAGRHPPR